MTDGLTPSLLAITAIVGVAATWWLVRHELAVRRFRARSDRPGSIDPR